MNRLTAYKHCVYSVMLTLIFASSPSHAGFKKWLQTEVIPTVTGKRALKFNPNRITITHDGKKRLELGPDSAFLRIGSTTIKTHQLRLRLQQAGCVYATGNIAQCAPDILDRELKKLLRGEFPDVINYNESGLSDDESRVILDSQRRARLEEEERLIRSEQLRRYYAEDRQKYGIAWPDLHKPTTGKFERMWITQNVTLQNDKGIVIHAQIDIKNSYQQPIKILCHFMYPDGRPLIDNNGIYESAYGDVQIISDQVPVKFQFTKVYIEAFIPYAEFNLRTSGRHDLKVICRARTRGFFGTNPRIEGSKIYDLTQSGFYSFSVTIR